MPGKLLLYWKTAVHENRNYMQNLYGFLNKITLDIIINLTINLTSKKNMVFPEVRNKNYAFL